MAGVAPPPRTVLPADPYPPVMTSRATTGPAPTGQRAQSTLSSFNYPAASAPVQPPVEPRAPDLPSYNEAFSPVFDPPPPDDVGHFFFFNI